MRCLLWAGFAFAAFAQHELQVTFLTGDMRAERWTLLDGQLRRESGGVTVLGRDAAETVSASKTQSVSRVAELPPIRWQGVEAAGAECQGGGWTIRVHWIEHPAAEALRPVHPAAVLPERCLPPNRLPVRLEVFEGPVAPHPFAALRVRSAGPAVPATPPPGTWAEFRAKAARPLLAERLEYAEEKIDSAVPAHRAAALETAARLSWQSGQFDKAARYAARLIETPSAARYHLHNAHTMLGVLALRKDDTASALKHLKESGAPEPVPVRIDLAERLLALGELEAVARFYQAAATENQELRRQYQEIAASLRRKVIPPLGRHQPRFEEPR
ncbi:MAG: hypothetical protein FJW30_04570 [Acidobacteria bacterium]|nr:hypothetical protein [Acidobacteriota bacterium]